MGRVTRTVVLGGRAGSRTRAATMLLDRCRGQQCNSYVVRWCADHYTSRQSFVAMQDKHEGQQELQAVLAKNNINYRRWYYIAR